jgi:hypothetical protein
MAVKKKSKKAKKTRKPVKAKKPAAVKRSVKAKKSSKKAKRPAKAKTRVITKKSVKAKKVVKAKRSAKRASPLEGEGSYTAARNYDKGTEQFIAKNKSKISRMAHDAEAALEGPEGNALRAAEDEGRSKARD